MLVRIRTMYGLRKTGTNLWMLETKGAYSWSAFTDIASAKLGPRLFPTEKAAKTALSMWCKGGWTKKGVTAADHSKYTPETMTHPPEEPRNPWEYEVVKVVLSVHKEDGS